MCESPEVGAVVLLEDLLPVSLEHLRQGSLWHEVDCRGVQERALESAVRSLDLILSAMGR